MPSTTPKQGPGGSNLTSGAGTTPADTPVPTATPIPQWPSGTPGVPGDNPGNLTPAIPTLVPTPVGSPTPVPTVTPAPTRSATPTATPSPSVTPQPELSGRTSGWGTDKSTYNRGDTVIGWVDVTNTGNVPITEVDITIVLARTDFPVSKTDNFKSQGLNILPGQTQRITFSETIPPTYGGISTAGNYRLTASAYLAGNDIGSYTKDIAIV